MNNDAAALLKSSLCLYVGEKSVKGDTVLWASGDSKFVDALLERLSPLALSAFVSTLLCKELVREGEDHDSGGILVVVDLKDFLASSITSKLVEACKRVVEHCQQRYGGRLKRLLFVRTPFVFSALWTQLQDSMCESAKAKATVLREGQTQLLQTIAQEEGIILPEELAGAESFPVFVDDRLLSRRWSCSQLLREGLGAEETVLVDKHLRIGELERSVAAIMQAIEEEDRTNPEWMRGLIEYYDQAEIEMIGENASLRSQVAELELQLELLNQNKVVGELPGGKRSEDKGEKSRSVECLRHELDATLEQAAAYQRTVQFARNYIETEAKLSRDEEARYTKETSALEEDNATLQAWLEEASLKPSS